MHALHLTFKYKPAAASGLTESVAAIAEGLVRRGHRVTVFATDAGLPQERAVPLDRPVAVEGVEVWYFRRHVPLWARAPGVDRLSRVGAHLPARALVPALRRILRDVDVVHMHVPYVRPANVAARIALASGKPLFYSPHGAFHQEVLRENWFKKSIYIAMVAKPVMRRAAGLIALTHREAESIRRLGVRAPCHVVPNGIDAGQFRRLPRAGSLARFGIRPDQRVVLFLGRLLASKGLELLVDAFLRIAEAHPDAALVLAGLGDEQFVRTLRDRVQRHDLEHRVLFCGLVRGDEKLDLLARADLFVLPSRSEGQSMAVLEALASGTPVLLSAACDFDVAAASGAGWVVEPGVDRLAAALAQLLADPQLLRQAGDRGFELALSSLGWHSRLAQLENLYAGAVGQTLPAGQHAAPHAGAAEQ